MRACLVFACVGAALVSAWAPTSIVAIQSERGPEARESRIPVLNASLWAREIGQGPPVIVLHGGPDFDCGYLLPSLDRLADTFRLIYYDQRGRGKSASGVNPDDVTLASDIDDIDAVRQHFQLKSATLLGHSWGTVLALEYALRHPTGVSQLILMNPAPASASDLAMFRKAYATALGAEMEQQRAITAGATYKAGDPEAVAARYRIHFKHALARPDDYERLMARMRAGFISQGKEGILKARAVEDRLMRDSWQNDGYDLLPRLRSLSIPTLVVFGDRDFIPSAIAVHIAQAIPDARIVALKGCGHFSFLECPGDLKRAIDDFVRTRPGERKH